MSQLKISKIIESPHIVNHKDTCGKCGSDIIGDGYTIRFHCENVDIFDDCGTPDDETLECDFEEDNDDHMRLGCPVINSRCDFYGYLRDRDDEVVTSYCFHIDNLEGNCTSYNCPKMRGISKAVDGFKNLKKIFTKAGLTISNIERSLRSGPNE